MFYTPWYHRIPDYEERMKWIGVAAVRLLTRSKLTLQ